MDDVTAVPASLSGRSSRRCGRNRINDGVSTTPPTGWKGPVSIWGVRGFLSPAVPPIPADGWCIMIRACRNAKVLTDRELCPV